MSACGLQGTILECKPDDIQRCYHLIGNALAHQPELSAAITVDAWLIGTIIQALTNRGLKIPGSSCIFPTGGDHDTRTHHR